MTVVTGKYVAADGTPAVGSVTFVLSHPLLEVARTTEPVRVRVRLDADGAFATELAPNVGGNPDGTVYQVTVAVYGAPSRTWPVVIDDVPTVDLSTLTPAEPSDPQTSYLTSAALDAALAGLTVGGGVL